MIVKANCPQLRMNTVAGKQILAMIRDGDYAHPGEAEAVRMTFQDIKPSSSRRLLDVGCGLGGTADLVSSLGLGRVTGIDIDPATIEYARTKYPSHQFYCVDARHVSSVVDGVFHVIYMFNSLYTMDHHREVLTDLARVSRTDTELRVFDYSVRNDDARCRQFALNYEGSRWNPISIDKLEDLFEGTGWLLSDLKDITSDYLRWYAKLVEMIAAKEDVIVRNWGHEWFDYAQSKYRAHLEAAQDNVIGGVILNARRQSK